MCFQRSAVWMHSTSLLGVSFTRAAQSALVIALASPAPPTTSPRATDSDSTHERFGMRPALQYLSAPRRDPGMLNAECASASTTDPIATRPLCAMRWRSMLRRAAGRAQSTLLTLRGQPRVDVLV